MFNLTGSEIIVILLLALVILGPEKLPEAMRKAGRAYNELRKMANSFQSEVRSVIDEPMNELRGTADMLRDATDFTGTKNKPATPKPARAGGARPAAGPPAADSADNPPAAEPPVAEPGAEPPVAEPPVAEPGADGEADAAPAEDEHGKEDVVTRTLSGDVDAQAHADEAGPRE